jgi:hypothetical protein
VAGKTPGRTHLPWTAALLVLLPIAAFVLCETIVSLYAAQPDLTLLLTASNEGANAQAPLREAIARMNIIALFTLYLAFSAAILAKFVSDLRLFGAGSRQPILAVFGVAVALGLGVIVWIFTTDAGATRALGRALFAGAFGLPPDANLSVLSPAVREAEAGDSSSWGAAAFLHLRIVAALITTATVGAFVAGGISCLARFDALDEREGWLFQCERLRSYIYFSAALLVVGVLYMKAWTGYPAHLLAEQDGARADFLGLVNAYVMFSGIEYSILLAAYALPVAAILSRRADVIAARIVADEEQAQPVSGLALFGEKVKKARTGAGLVFSTEAVVKAIVALLAPLITGGVASLSTFFG